MRLTLNVGFSVNLYTKLLISTFGAIVIFCTDYRSSGTQDVRRNIQGA
jgi:hypothetical protein